MVNVLITSDTRYPLNRKIVRKAVGDALKKLKVEGGIFEVSIAVVGARKMKLLTGEYLDDDKRHQILTFALEELSPAPRILNLQGDGNAKIESQGFIKSPDGVLRLGDIILCWPQLVAEAAEDEMMVDDKIYELTAHGVEHLLGQHHGERAVE